MADRERLIGEFLSAHGWAKASRAPLAGDASFRRYERLAEGDRRAVLMDAPPDREDVHPYLRVARILRAHGYSAPEIYAEDAAGGLLLIEDLGDDTFTRVLAAKRPEQERILYTAAVDLLIDLHRRNPQSLTEGIPDYDDGRLNDEAVLLVDWYMPAVLGEPVPEKRRREYLELWTALYAVARAVPATLVLRDYHVDNLIWLPDRPGAANCGLLDFQDAVAGPVSYDLVSLLEDARRDIPPALVRDMCARYLAAFPALDADDFDASYAVMGAQRNAKIVGIFTRLARRDKKPAYLAHIPRVWRLLEGDLAHPALKPMADWLERFIPPELRRVPDSKSAA